MTVVRGWCPSAHRPMASGDGLIVRVRPRMARLTAGEMRALCDLAERYGSGILELTSRGNLQLRGVAEADHPALLAGLVDAGLVAADPAQEASVTVTPFWRPGDLTDRLGHALEARLGDLPHLPGKMSVVLDTGPTRRLAEVSGDFRLEQAAGGGVLLRADGAALGLPVPEENAIDALIELAQWFLDTGGRASGRMRRHLARVDLPAGWRTGPAASAETPPGPDPAAGRLGLAFGQVTACALMKIVDISGASEVRLTPWRLLFLGETSRANVDLSDFIAETSDPLLRVEACPGAPFCTQATVETRALARALAGHISGRLHVSGCAKGCATQKLAEVTLVGREGRFDLVRNGRPGDRPLAAGLMPEEVRERLSQHA